MNLMNRSLIMNYRRCFVCLNDSKNSPDKIFVRIRENLLEEWCKLAKVDIYKKKTAVMFCCEDHIDPYEDLENYFKVKLMKAEPKLKYHAKLRKVWDQKVTDHATLQKESKTSRPVSELERLLLTSELPKPTCSKAKAQSSSHDESSSDGASGDGNRSEVVDESAEIVDESAEIVDESAEIVDESAEIFEDSINIVKSEFANAADGLLEIDECAVADGESAESNVSHMDEVEIKVETEMEDEDMDEVEIKVEAEMEDEHSAASPDPLKYDVAGSCKDVMSHQKEEDAILQLEDPVTIIKAEFDFDSPADLHAEDHTKLREEIAMLKTANLRLTNENQALNATNKSLVKRIQNLIQGNKGLINVGAKSILLKTIKIDSHSPAEQHSGPPKNINTLQIENGKHLNRIQELLKKNRVLMSRIIEVNDRNKHLTDKISKVLKENEVSRRKAELVTVFADKIKKFNEDVRSLKEENKLLEKKVRELEERRYEEEKEERMEKERVKMKRK